MDTSENYIKMSDCPEIQDGWKPNSGDYFTKRSRKTVELYHCGHEGWPFEDTYIRFYVFLPRQDQIQEMIGNYPILYFLRMLYLKFDPWFKPNSFEQLWLAFYMWEKHGKIWKDNKWVKKEG